VADTSLLERIGSAWTELSPQEQRAAEFMRGHLDDLAVYNATEVASLSGVSKATISRLYRRLGFDGAEDVRDHLRAVRGAPIVPATSPSLADHLEQEFANLRSALAGIELETSARLIANARRVLVIGFRNSYPVALHLRQQLAQARDGVELGPNPGQSLGEELAGLDARDVVMLVGFRRRPESFARLVDVLSAGPAKVILLTDSAHPHRTDVVLRCPVESVSGFDSYAAVSSVVSLLASAVLVAVGDAGRVRLSAIADSYAALDELETM
jgi:DNA-binding MurR/RpiR family transcriptional regulator